MADKMQKEDPSMSRADAMREAQKKVFGKNALQWVIPEDKDSAFIIYGCHFIGGHLLYQGFYSVWKGGKGLFGR